MEPAPVMRIIKMNLNEWPYLLLGSFAAAINGLFPFAFALVLSEVLAVSKVNFINEHNFKRFVGWLHFDLSLRPQHAVIIFKICYICCHPTSVDWTKILFFNRKDNDGLILAKTLNAVLKSPCICINFCEALELAYMCIV